MVMPLWLYFKSPMFVFRRPTWAGVIGGLAVLPQHTQRAACWA